jgi:hypothetical protein
MNIYHFTNYYKLIDILDSGKLKAGTMFKYGYIHKTFKDLPKGGIISFTRNINVFSTFNTGTCLVFDRNKLKENYKLQPYNDYPHRSKHDNRVESEEIIIKKEIDISKYLKKVLLFDSNYGGSILNSFSDKINIEFENIEHLIKYLEDTYEISFTYIPSMNNNILKRKYLKSFENFKYYV